MDDIRNLFPLRPQIQENPEPQAVVPHIYSFQSVYNSFQRMYSYRFDEALRNLPSNALSMRRDCFIEALLQERIYPTANRSWSIKVPDQRDPYQSYVARCTTEAIRAIPRFDRLRMYLMEASWYGRYGAHVSLGKRRISGKELWTVTAHRPVNGDKLFFDFDGTPAVGINPTMQSAYPRGLTRITDRGMTVLVLKRPEHRRQFIIHQHQVTDADYFEPEMAGGVHGTGLRNKVYWAWWLRDEMLAWATDFMQKVGTLGLLVFFYEDGNAKAKAAAETAAAQASTEVALTMPSPNTANGKATNQVMHVAANTGGVEALQGMIADYFERHIERLFVGQPSSGDTKGNGFGGSAGAALHADTKYQLLKWDARNLDETLTLDLVTQLVCLNHPDVDFPVTFESAVANPEDAAKLQGVQTAAQMGVTFKMDEVRALTGMSKPEEFDEVVGGALAAAGGEGDGAFGDSNPGEEGEGDDSSRPGQGVTANASVEREKGSGQKWADIAAYADDGSFFACYVDDEESGGHWVTIGARQGDDGKRHGGVPVLIKGGRIVKGPKGMVGKSPKEVGRGGAGGSGGAGDNKRAEHEQRFGEEAVADEPAYPPEWDDPINPETASKNKPKLRVTAAMKAKLPKGAKLEHVAELAADLRDNTNAMIEYHNEALRYARRQSIDNGYGDFSALAAKANSRGKDVEALKGYDDIATQTMSSYPGLLREDDPRFHPSDVMFELLVQGIKPKMKDHEAWDLAVDYVNANGLDRRDDLQAGVQRSSEEASKLAEHIAGLRGEPDEPQAAEEFVNRMAGKPKGELFAILSDAGVEGLKMNDSKASMLKRLKLRLTAPARARLRNEV